MLPHYTMNSSELKQRLEDLRTAADSLRSLAKEAFMAAPPMPAPGGAPPMDPSMMGGGGMPMDPSMMGGMPAGGGMPMDPSMMGGGGGMPMDPSMMGGDPAAGGMPPEAMDQILGVLEELAAANEAATQELSMLKEQVADMQQQIDEMDKAMASMAAASAAPNPNWS